MKETIMNELKIWQTAYPEHKKLLEDFANKIYFELKCKRCGLMYNTVKKC